MLSDKEAKIIGRNKCMTLIGEEYCLEHNHLACGSFGIVEGKMQCFIGIDDNNESTGLLSGERPFDIRAHVSVDMDSGAIEILDFSGPQ